MRPEELARALRTVREARLRLLELARELMGKDGGLDLEKAAFLRKELEEAIAEAEEYARATREATSALKQMARSES